MKRILVDLNPEMYRELAAAAAACYDDEERTPTPEDFARECIECVLAARRQDRRERLAVAS